MRGETPTSRLVNPLRFVALTFLAGILAPFPTAPAHAGSAGYLSFEDRVRAQEAIERVYYSHQIGTTRPFDEAVPQSVIEAKVRKYLQQSIALERYWQTPVTAEMLERELLRMTHGTQMPDRLQELLVALDGDPLSLIHI